ncbi:uncharacterized protein LOC135847061 [Planococcus citri]|uniref:uncharacterized protein LOC135847061 n=1 Tax=Planococcus citri TaxID=170843 RepID=UPI0031F9E759
MEGIGGTSATAPQFATTLTIRSRHSPYEIEVYAKILRTITHYTSQIAPEVIDLLQQPGVPLADDFRYDSPIDILLGAEYWATIMQAGKLELTSSIPPLLNSNFGWLVSGSMMLTPSAPSAADMCCFTLEEQLRQFWEIEDAPIVSSLSQVKKLTPAELECETYFTKTTTRDPTGRYVVRLPFNEKVSQLGNSYRTAERQFYQIENRMRRDSDYRAKYHAVMRDYERLGHMQPAKASEGSNYFLPHHAVTRPDDPAKFRVIFNGSQKTSTGISLNDVLHIGPAIQRQLSPVFAGFRRHLVAFMADMEQMYRQIGVNFTDIQYQQILWRYSPNDPLLAHYLTTVTFGVGPSAWLALQTSEQLVADKGHNFPAAAPVLLKDRYIDDVSSGAESIEAARQLVSELSQLCARGQFNLRKWASNEPEAISNVTHKAEAKSFSFDKDGRYSKVLGMLWETDSDELAYHANLPEIEGTLTKRKLLSYLSRIFDPLGLLSPITIVAKCLLRELWLQPVTWDAPLSHDIKAAYNTFRSQTNEHLHRIRIPRHVGLSPTVTYSLHGFSDASETAYACCVYIKVTFDSGKSMTHLIGAKTRVAPVKTISIPRLELCGAVLLSRTITSLADTYPCVKEQRFGYTDSTIVLS